jgi:DNA-binding transcriptional LysR family regulator
VGVQLLERDNRRVRLTPAGRAFLAESRRILAIAEEAPALAQRVSSGMRGVIKLGFTSASTFGHLGRILDYLNLELPEVHVELFEMVTREQIDALTAGDIDMGLARPPFDPELFESRLLHREALVPADLVGVPLIFHSQQKARYFYDLVVSMVPLAQERVIHTVSQVMTMLWLVSRGRGVAFVPDSAGMIGVPNVSYLRIATPIPEPVELHVIWPRKSDNPALPRAISALSFMMH